MRWLLYTAIVSLFIGCGATPSPYFVDTLGFEQEKIVYSVVSDVEPKIRVTRFGPWSGSQMVNSMFIEKVVGLLVRVDGERVRLKANIEANKKAIKK